MYILLAHTVLVNLINIFTGRKHFLTKRYFNWQVHYNLLCKRRLLAYTNVNVNTNVNEDYLLAYTNVCVYIYLLQCYIIV